MAKLTPKQKRFVDEFLIDLNATRSYKAAYPNVKKDEVAASAAARLLRNVKVQEYLKLRQQKLQERTEITQNKVLLELARIAFANGADIAKIVTKPIKSKVWNHKTEEYEEEEIIQQFVELIDTDELSADKKAAITAIKETKFGISVETADKLKALELIGKHLGMFTDKLEVKDTTDNPFTNLTTEELRKLIKNE